MAIFAMIEEEWNNAEIEKFTVAEQITTSWDIHGDETLDDTELREF